MSDTIVDFAKVTQMLDANWTVRLTKGGMGTYYATAEHRDESMMEERAMEMGNKVDPEFRDLAINTAFETDDFTPEQALTRLAYKVMGQVI